MATKISWFTVGLVVMDIKIHREGGGVAQWLGRPVHISLWP